MSEIEQKQRKRPRYSQLRRQKGKPKNRYSLRIRAVAFYVFCVELWVLCLFGSIS